MQASSTGLAKALLDLERSSTVSSTAWIYPSIERKNEKTNTKENIYKKVSPFAVTQGYFTQSTVRLHKQNYYFSHCRQYKLVPF